MIFLVKSSGIERLSILFVNLLFQTGGNIIPFVNLTDDRIIWFNKRMLHGNILTLYHIVIIVLIKFYYIIIQVAKSGNF